MKLATVLFASTFVVLGIAACASPSDEQEETSTTSQALCPRGMICQPKTGGWLGGTSSSGFNEVYDPGTSSSGGTTTENACNVSPGATFTCGGKVPSCGSIAKTTTETCDLTLRCTSQGCDCIPGCGGGSWGFGSWNPCLYGHTYSCTPWGTCSCN